jgi:hypothetical protein
VSISVREHDVLFTGGVPGDSVEDVFRVLAGSVGGRALAYPDGEIGERRAWILTLNTTTWPNVDGLEEIPVPLPEDHPARIFKTFTIKQDVDKLDLKGLLPYARGAIESYGVFTRLREEGIIDPGVRFQMAIPAAHDAVTVYFPHIEDWPRAFEAWTEAVQDEYRRMLEVIPADDLVIQIDYCTELVHMAHAFDKLCDWVPDAPSDETLATYTTERYVAPHVATLPEETVLGYHICAGTFPTQPVAELKDLSLPVAIANALAVRSDRRVDYFHLPVMRESDESYFAPLEGLAVGDAAVYLGLECNDGLDAMQRRITDARRVLPDFGVAHYCGYVWNQDILPELLADLAAGADHNARPLSETST